jgi:nitroreductase
MDLRDIIASRRTVRQFLPKKVAFEVLTECVDAGRMAPSARNMQPLEYIIIDSNGPLDEMFKCMGFGGDLKDFSGKEPGAYIVVLLKKDLITGWSKYDSGMAVENMVLTAFEKGLGSCVLAKINREKIIRLLNIPDRYGVDLVIALGYPAEQPVAVDLNPDDGTGYYRDEKGRLHIPKRRLEDILHKNGF